MTPEEEKLFLDQFYALHKDRVLLSIFEKYGIAAFRRSCVLRNFERFIKQVGFSGKRCVEIGTCNGLTALVLARYFDEVVSIDNAPNKLKHEILKFAGVNNVRLLDCRDNDHKAEIVNGLDFDGAFSDANHAHDTLFDFDLVKRCGRVLFDEYWQYQMPVWRLVNNLTRSGIIRHDWKFALWTRSAQDRFISEYRAEPYGDLMICPGVAYQADMSNRIQYDESYFINYVERSGTEIAKALNNGRRELVDKHVGAGTEVLDIGIGSGEFIQSRDATFGYDINPKAVRWLKQNERFSEEFEKFRAFTFWDVIEHVCDPNEYFKRIAPGSFVFVSIPVFDNLRNVRNSKHYKPGEHLYYWTVNGFIDWMKQYGFKLLETTDFETRAGRDGIMSFAFRRG